MEKTSRKEWNASLSGDGIVADERTMGAESPGLF